MNAAARALAQETFSTSSLFQKVLLRENLLVISLCVAVFVSAFSVVYVRDMNRRLFAGLQEMRTVQNQLHLQWGQLLLEQSTWSTQARIQYIAQHHLDMELPTSKNSVMVQ